MTPDQILYIIIGIVAIDYAYNQLLDIVNLKARKSELPDEISDFYDADKYAKANDYHKTLGSFSFLTSGISLIVSLLVLSLGGFGYLDALLRPLVGDGLVLSLSFFGVLFILSDVLTLPFSLYSTFVIEEKFGFNKTTPKTFIVDKLKGYVLTIIVGGGLLSILIYLVEFIGVDFWLYFWLVASVFIIFVNMFYTSLIVPLFNKLTPLEDGALKTAIEGYSKNVNFPLESIFVIDGSKRSSKANAFFSGIGKRKKIVLYDTLINNHSIEELVGILAHEVGHYKKKHIISGLFTSLGQIGLMLFVMSLVIYNEEVSLALGGSQWAIHLNLLAFGILYSPLSTILSIVGNIISRKNEFEADAFAKQTYGKEHLQTALKKLSVDNLSNLYPHPLYVFIHYSHPPLLSRLKALNQ